MAPPISQRALCPPFREWMKKEKKTIIISPRAPSAVETTTTTSRGHHGINNPINSTPSRLVLRRILPAQKRSPVAWWVNANGPGHLLPHHQVRLRAFAYAEALSILHLNHVSYSSFPLWLFGVGMLPLPLYKECDPLGGKWRVDARAKWNLRVSWSCPAGGIWGPTASASAWWASRSKRRRKRRRGRYGAIRPIALSSNLCVCVCVCVHPVINLNTFKVVKREGQVKRGFYLMRRESVRDYVCVCKSSVGWGVIRSVLFCIYIDNNNNNSRIDWGGKKGEEVKEEEEEEQGRWQARRLSGVCQHKRATFPLSTCIDSL